MSIGDFLRHHKWNIKDTQKIPSRQAEYCPYNDLNLSTHSIHFLKFAFPKGIYRHQKEAIKGFLSGDNICLTTGTASGKSLLFYVAAIEKIVRFPKSKIIAIYPSRALGKEQEERWINALTYARLKATVGRVDGQTAGYERNEIIERSQILICTPDIMHAWLLYNIRSRIVTEFLKHVVLLILDEIHNYSGVFGSNSAYLFRRVQYLMNLLGTKPQFIGASATIASPLIHLNKLTGLPFSLIDATQDSSPRQELTIKLIEIPLKFKNKDDLLTPLSKLIEYIVKSTKLRFICFVDSRKQTEYIASIVSRSQMEEDIGDSSLEYNPLSKLNVLPYRAGYELNDRNLIQQRLSTGTLRGVISTSALELGIDIPYLDAGILIGVPRSSTSLYQRIGRVGRHSKGEILIINNGDVYNEDIFLNPQQLLNMPLSEGALYLENERIQYIHTLCLARQNGEYDQLCSAINKTPEQEITSVIDWAKGFTALCKAERLGIIPIEFQNMKAQAGEDPNHLYPLRDIDIQFKVEYNRGPTKQSIGSLTYGQVLREAYPGAVYYYATNAFRVYRVRMSNRLIEVRHEKKYTTKPAFLPTLVFPNFSQDNVYQGREYNKLIIAECNLQVRETINGFTERRGSKVIAIRYPLDHSTGLYFDLPFFTRNFFTTGVIFIHPDMNKKKIQINNLAQLLYEAFLIIIPFDERDVNRATDKTRVQTGNIKNGSRFVCIYDQTYGSLRLTGRIIEEQTLRLILEKALELSKKNKNLGINTDTIKLIEEMLKQLFKPPKPFHISIQREIDINEQKQTKIVMPGSKGVYIGGNNEEFLVEGVYYNPSWNSLAYRGKYVNKKNEPDSMYAIRYDLLKEIPGESKLGLYNYATGETTSL